MKSDELRERFSKSGRTQAWLAEQLGVRPNTVHRWLKGSMAIPGYRDRAIREVLPLPEGKR